MDTLSVKCLKFRLNDRRWLPLKVSISRMPTMMWEILVPAMHNGAEIQVEYHNIWDNFVRDCTNGMTILKRAKGSWLHPDTNALVSEPMIPVRIVCSREDILKISKFTKQHYDQHTVLAYQISTDVITT